MKNSFLHQPIFRSIAPIIYSNIVYVMVLLIFDRAGQLIENFEPYEWATILIMTYAQFEGLRWLNAWLERHLTVAQNLRFRVVAQLLSGVIFTIALISGLVSAYFYFLVNYSTFWPELFTFNTIFAVSSIYYNLLHFTVFYLTQQNKTALEKEEALRKGIEYRLQAFKNEVNPDFLYESLESVLSYISESPEAADNHLQQLSEVYRYMLDNRHDELISLEKEIRAAENLTALLKIRHGNHICFRANIDHFEDLQRELVPGTLPRLVENMVRVSLISERQPLIITCWVESDQYLVLQAPLNERLKPQKNPMKEIEDLQRAYAFYTEEPLVKVKAYGEMLIRIPMLSLEIEELDE